MGDEFNLMDHSDLYILDFSKYPCHYVFCLFKKVSNLAGIQSDTLLTPLLHFSPGLACLALALLCVITWGTSVSSTTKYSHFLPALG